MWLYISICICIFIKSLMCIVCSKLFVNAEASLQYAVFLRFYHEFWKSSKSNPRILHRILFLLCLFPLYETSPSILWKIDWHSSSLYNYIKIWSTNEKLLLQLMWQHSLVIFHLPHFERVLCLLKTISRNFLQVHNPTTSSMLFELPWGNLPG